MDASTADLHRLKTQFLSLVSHDLLSPLASIKGYVELVMKASDGSLNEKQRKHLQIVLSNTNRLEGFIDYMLEMVRLDAGLLELQRAPVHLKSLVEEAAGQLQKLYEFPTDKIHLQLPSSMSPVLVDPLRMRKVFSILFLHALRQVSAPTGVEVQGRSLEQEVEVRVVERGVSLTALEIQRLFHRFEENSGSSQGLKNVKLNSLALALAKSLVDLHRGRLWGENLGAEGFCFFLRLPSNPGASSRPKEVVG